MAVGRRRLGLLLLLLRLVLPEVIDQLVNPALVALRLIRREVRVTLGEFLPKTGLVRLGLALLLNELTDPAGNQAQGTDSEPDCQPSGTRHPQRPGARQTRRGTRPA